MEMIQSQAWYSTVILATQETEAGGSHVQGKSELYSEFKTILFENKN